MNDWSDSKYYDKESNDNKEFWEKIDQISEHNATCKALIDGEKDFFENISITEFSEAIDYIDDELNFVNESTEIHFKEGWK